MIGIGLPDLPGWAHLTGSTLAPVLSRGLRRSPSLPRLQNRGGSYPRRPDAYIRG